MVRKSKAKEIHLEPTDQGSDHEALGFIRSILGPQSTSSQPTTIPVPDLKQDTFDEVTISVTPQEEPKVADKESPKETKPSKTKSELSEEQKRLTVWESALMQKARELAEQEANAEANFSKQNRQATEELEKQVNFLRQQLNQLRQQIMEERSQLHFKWEQERQRLYEAFQNSLAQEEAVVRARHLALEEEQSKKQKEWQEQCHIREQEHLKRELELRQKQNQLTIQEELLAEDRAALEQKIELRAGEELKRLRLELQIARDFNQMLQKERNELETRLRAYEELHRKLGNREPEEILADLKKKEQEIQRLHHELAQAPSPEILQELQQAQIIQKQLQHQISELTYQYSKSKVQQDHALIAATELETLRDANKILTVRCEQSLNYVAKLEEEVSRYRKFTEVPKERQVRIGVIEEPLYKIKRDPPNPKIDEFEWLEQTALAMESCGFYFPRRLLYAFHTSLKIAEWSSLSILTGISGTGKSELPRLYARFGGLEFEAIAVQPNWDSPQDLFGFFNYMDNRFNAKPLLRAMVQSQLPKEKFGFNDGLLLVLLDEMNLARVEQYFSDLLSKLELRRGETQTVYLNIDLGSGLEPYPVPLGKNILFVGTINEDESTQTLSDKAVDRSNVIAFPSPYQFRSRETLYLGDKKGFLSFSTWQTWLRTPSFIKEDIRTKFKTTVEEINRCLATVGRALGHRVWQSMENYIANHPEVCKATKEIRGAKEGSKASESKSKDKDTSKAQERLEGAYQRAFEDQIVQKIMPKLRGVETEGHARKFCLDPIAEIIRKEALGLLEDYQNACEKGHGTFLWHSAHYLEAEE